MDSPVKKTAPTGQPFISAARVMSAAVFAPAAYFVGSLEPQSKSMEADVSITIKIWSSRSSSKSFT